MRTKILLDSSVANKLAQAYNILHYEAELKKSIYDVLDDPEIYSYSKYQLHQLVNNLLRKCYEGEEQSKALLVKEFIKKKVVGAFEVKVRSSRVDFITINGVSTSFEIKSKFDNLKKLEKQTADYADVFDYNYVLIDERHLDKSLCIIPDSFGVYVKECGGKTLVRRAKKNSALSSKSQIHVLTKRETNKFFGSSDHQQILENFSGEKINQVFKQCLKERYSSRWTFLVEQSSNILPIDYQFFFNSNINPALIYQNHTF